MEYQTDQTTGNRIMSEVWECPHNRCYYQTNIVEDRRKHRSESHCGNCGGWVSGIEAEATHNCGRPGFWLAEWLRR